MERKLFAFAAFALVLFAGALSAALSVDGYTITPSTLKPGEEGSVSFNVKNAVPTSSTSTASLEEVQVFFGGTTEGMEFKAKSPYVIGTIESGSTATVSVPFRVLPSAKAGVLTTTFYISQKDKTDLKTVNAVVRVVNPPIISLSLDHKVVGSAETLNLSINNNGGSASKLVVKLDDGSNFSFIGTTQIYVGEVAKSAWALVPLDSRKVADGVQAIPFVVSYQQEGGDSANESMPLTVTVRKEKADVSFSQEEPVITNKDNVLHLSVTNKGRQLANLRIILTDTSVQPKDSSQITIGDLPSGGTKSFEIPVFVNQQPGVKSTAFLLKWVEDEVEKEQALSIPITISSDAEVGIYMDAKPTPLMVGSNHTLSVTVSNLGSYKIANVVISIEPNDAFEVLNIQPEQYIGNLDNDAFSTVQYKIKVKGGIAAGTYPLTFKARYKDQSGLWIEEEIKTSVSVQPPHLGDNGLLYLVGAAALIGGGYWYFKMRKPAQAAQPKK